MKAWCQNVLWPHRLYSKSVLERKRNDFWQETSGFGLCDIGLRPYCEVVCFFLQLNLMCNDLEVLVDLQICDSPFALLLRVHLQYESNSPKAESPLHSAVAAEWSFECTSCSKDSISSAWRMKLGFVLTDLGSVCFPRWQMVIRLSCMQMNSRLSVKTSAVPDTWVCGKYMTRLLQRSGHFAWQYST